MTILYYIHDPMCSWCWAFAPIWQKIQQQLPHDITITYLLGGLAPDNENSMPLEQQQLIQQHWRTIEKRVPATQFNYDFWQTCEPRRSTYPACRAVIAARKQNPDAQFSMILAIQKAYYLYAQNPSLNETLLNLADQLKLNVTQFSRDIDSDETQLILNNEIKLSHQLSNNGFPDLVLKTQHSTFSVPIDYLSDKNVLNFIQTQLK